MPGFRHRACADVAGAVETLPARRRKFGPGTANLPRAGLIMLVGTYRKRVAAMAIQLATDDPELVKQVIARLRKSGDIEPDDLVYLDRIADRWDQHCPREPAKGTALATKPSIGGGRTPLTLAISRAILSSRSERSSASVWVQRPSACSMSSRVGAPAKSRPRNRYRSTSPGVNRSVLPARSMVWTLLAKFADRHRAYRCRVIHKPLGNLPPPRPGSVFPVPNRRNTMSLEKAPPRPKRSSVEQEEERAWISFYRRVGNDPALATEVLVQLDCDPQMKRMHLALYLCCRQSLQMNRERQARNKRIGQFVRWLCAGLTRQLLAKWPKPWSAI